MLPFEIAGASQALLPMSPAVTFCGLVPWGAPRRRDGVPAGWSVLLQHLPALCSIELAVFHDVPSIPQDFVHTGAHGLHLGQRVREARRESLIVIRNSLVARDQAQGYEIQHRAQFTPPLMRKGRGAIGLASRSVWGRLRSSEFDECAPAVIRP